MMRSTAILLAFTSASFLASAHDVITTKVTWTREISRLMYKNCTSCHRAGGSASDIPLTTYQEARPWAKAIKEEMLERRMPPFAAMKGFGELRNDHALTQEQLELISDWVEGGAPEGDPTLLPKEADLEPKPESDPKLGPELVVNGTATLSSPTTLEAVRPTGLKPGSSVRVVAQAPDGTVTPLIWIYKYNPKFEQTFYFKEPLKFPAGTKILTSSPDAGSLSFYAAAGGAGKPAPKTSASLRK